MKQGSKNRTANTGQQGKESQNRTARTGQPEQDRQNKTVRTRLPEEDIQDCQDKAVRTEQAEWATLTKATISDRTTGICKSGQDSQNRTE